MGPVHTLTLKATPIHARAHLQAYEARAARDEARQTLQAERAAAAERLREAKVSPSLVFESAGWDEALLLLSHLPSPSLFQKPAANK